MESGFDSPQQPKDFDFSDAVERAKKIAAKLQQPGNSLKRSHDGSSDTEPDTKKVMSGTDIELKLRNIADHDRAPSASQAAQLALAKASQINAKLGISGPTATAPPDLVQVGANTSDTMMVPDHMVGLLIGKGGEQIAAIQSETQCMIQFATGIFHSF
jgi:far upstream element-binding protein